MIVVLFEFKNIAKFQLMSYKKKPVRAKGYGLSSFVCLLWESWIVNFGDYSCRLFK